LQFGEGIAMSRHEFVSSDERSKSRRSPVPGAVFADKVARMRPTASIWPISEIRSRGESASTARALCPTEALA
ncbi:hypothetical protein, partial [Hyphobacterium vulgare]